MRRCVVMDESMRRRVTMPPWMRFTGPDDVPVSEVVMSADAFRRLMDDVHRGYRRRHEARVVDGIPDPAEVTAAELRARFTILATQDPLPLP